MNLEALQDKLLYQTVFYNIKGNLDDNNSLVFKKNIFNIPEEKKYLILDLSLLRSLSGDGLRVFYESIRYFQKRGGHVILVKPKEEIQLLLKFLKINDFVYIVEDYEKAKDMIYNISQDTSDIMEIQSFHLENSEKNEKIQELVEKSEQRNLDSSENKEEVVSNNLIENRLLEENLKSINLKMNHLYQLITEQEKKDLTHDVNNEILEKMKLLDKKTDLVNLTIENKFNQLQNEQNNKYFELKEWIHSNMNQLSKRMIKIEDNQEKFEKEILDIKFFIEQNEKNFKIQKENLTDHLNEEEIERNYKKFVTFIQCKKCNAILRVQKKGNHICPNCNTKFYVLPNGEANFLDTL